MFNLPTALLASAAMAVATPDLLDTWNIQVLRNPYSPADIGIPESARSFPMTSASGQSYNCYVPPPPAAPEPTKPENELEKRAQQARQQLERQGRLCLLKTFDYWSYELCVGEQVRQFHKETVASAEKPSDVREVNTREYVLGVYASGADAVLSVEGTGGVYMLQQTYNAGAEGRSVTVQYDCDAGAGSKGTGLYEILSVSEPQPLHYVLLVASKDPTLCAVLPSPTRILAPLNHTCIEHVDGWWTYEICVGGTIRQYHNDNGKAAQESIIGVWDWAGGQRLEPNALTGPGTAAIVQKYNKGSGCDIRKGRPREAVLRFECNPSGSTGAGAGTATVPPAATQAAPGSSTTQSLPRTISLTLQGIKESPTCEYTITFSTPLVCEHPDAAPMHKAVVAPPPRPLFCVPLAAEEGEEDEAQALQDAATPQAQEIEAESPQATPVAVESQEVAQVVAQVNAAGGTAEEGAQSSNP